MGKKKHVILSEIATASLSSSSLVRVPIYNIDTNDFDLVSGGEQFASKYLISGGASWSGTGLVYDVTTLEYYFNGNKITAPTQVTLDASDPVDNRLDAIVVDESEVVSVITGTAASSPITPSIPENQLLVQYILVEAGSTQPTITKEDIYLENAEWTTSTYTTGTATGSIDFDNAVSPKQGVKCISANADARLGARFVRATSFDPYQYTMLSLWVRFTGSNVATNKSLKVRFENGAGALVANTINLFNFGLQRNLLNVWQLVVIPITAFGVLPTSVKGLKIIMTGGTVGQARQWDIDLISLTDNSVPSINEQVFNVLKDGALVGQSSTLNFKGAPVTVTNDPVNKKVDVEFAGGGGGGGYIEVTKAEADALITSSGLSKGAFYKITDRGDRGIILMATDTNKLAKHGKRIMLHPNPGIPIWADDDTAVEIDDLRVRGGKVYVNLTGNIGSASDYHTLDSTNWGFVSKSSFSNNEYIEAEFEIAYDYENDWIEMQRDKRNNVAVSPFGLVTGMGFSAWNPIDATDWLRVPMINNEFMMCCNNPYTQFISSNECFIMMDNYCALIANNVVKNPYGLGMIKNNRLKDGNSGEWQGVIVNNECTVIEDNTIEGAYAGISFNRVDGEIKNNICDGSILPEEEFARHAHISRNEAANIRNNNTRIIAMNYIKGDIEGNAVGGSLSFNSGEKILNNTCAGTDRNVLYNQVDVLENNTCAGIERNISTVIMNNNIGGHISDCECYFIAGCQNTGNIARVESNYIQGNNGGFPYAVPNTVVDLQNIDHEKVSFTKQLAGQPLVVGTPIVIGYLPKTGCRVLDLRVYGNSLTSSTDAAELHIKTGSDTLSSELIPDLNNNGYGQIMMLPKSTVDWQPVTIEALVEDITGGQIIIDFEYSKVYTIL